MEAYAYKRWMLNFISSLTIVLIEKTAFFFSQPVFSKNLITLVIIWDDNWECYHFDIMRRYLITFSSHVFQWEWDLIICNYHFLKWEGTTLIKWVHDQMSRWTPILKDIVEDAIEDKLDQNSISHIYYQGDPSYVTCL